MDHQKRCLNTGRHARLFELIRQRNAAQQVAARKSEAPSPAPDEAQMFRVQAERSLSPVDQLS